MDFVAELPCCVCGIEPSPDGRLDAHHVGHLGTAEKNSVVMVVPLCRMHHTEVEEHGEEWMERTYAPLSFRNVIIRTLGRWGLAEQDTNIFIPFYLK